MHQKGKLTSWNDEKGFGFITPKDSNNRVFIHANAFKRNTSRPTINQIITYTLSKDKLGRPCAINASRSGERRHKKMKHQSSSASTLFAFLFIILVAFAVFFEKLPILIFAIYGICSLITFAVYAIDKSAAQNGSWRTKEKTLHLLSLIGGWPGALVAQQKLRHKSSKQSFKIVFWLTVLINIAVFIWLLTPKGIAELYFFLAKYGINL